MHETDAGSHGNQIAATTEAHNRRRGPRRANAADDTLSEDRRQGDRRSTPGLSALLGAIAAADELEAEDKS